MGITSRNALKNVGTGPLAGGAATAGFSAAGPAVQAVGAMFEGGELTQA